MFRGDGTHLDERVACKVRRILLDTLRIVRDDLEPREDLPDLPQLVLIVRCNVKFHDFTSPAVH